MRLLFMGTPAFAVPSLRELIDSPHEVIGVVTQPDRPKGRGLRPAPPPVKTVAGEYGLPVIQPDQLDAPEFLRTLRECQAEVFVVVAFSILPAPVLSIPPRGTINLHASLLPKYRGAAPIPWAIINGETETGVTTFFIEQRVDTGQILLQRSTPIGPDETAGELHDRLATMGATLVRETVDRIAAGQARPVSQTGSPSRAPRLTKADGRIDWTQPAGVIHNRIRGMNPYPVAFTTWQDRTLRLLRSRRRPERPDGGGRAGEVVALDAEGVLVIQTGAGCLGLVELQPEGRRRMRADEFVHGYRLRPGDILGNDE
ncbi:MAG: methionyl-tRNA formyltransferase [Candidatus Latescibacteria bacterium]|nr:methionyl-tRNA formyltransferase [Candidatus Latescibacterota bacterium]